MKNPFIKKNNQPYNSVPFNDIKPKHFIPAIKYYIDISNKNIDNICLCQENPDFDNTIVSFETCMEDLDYVETVFQHLYASEADDEIRQLVNDINPLITKFLNNIYLNENLFIKIKMVYKNKKQGAYSNNQLRLIDETYNSFIRSGANLSLEDKKKYRKISEELSLLSPKFSDNVLNASNDINDYWIENVKNLEGLPQTSIDAAKILAETKKHPERWCFSLNTDITIIMKYCCNSSIRKEIMELYGSRCNGGKYDNTTILQKISKLRHKKANLLGYNTHADFQLDRRMAKSKDNVYNLINQLIEPSFRGAKKDLQKIKDHALKTDGVHDLNAWDTAYYAEQYKQSKYDFDEESLRPYFKAENVINGVFNVANKLYGLNFEQLDNIQLFHKDVKVYKVTDISDNYIGLLYEDLHPRTTKEVERG